MEECWLRSLEILLRGLPSLIVLAFLLGRCFLQWHGRIKGWMKI